MGIRKRQKDTLKKLRSVKPKTLKLSQEELVKVNYFQDGGTLPLVIQPGVYGLDLVGWTKHHLEFIEKQLLKHGAILFRNFNVNGLVEFEQFIKTISGELLEYRYRASPRTQINDRIYTSTDYPADQSIFPHNEHAYSPIFPLRIYFYSMTLPQQGGETPIGDTRRIFRRIEKKIVEDFIKKKVMYIRNYTNGFGLPWQEVFRTTDRGVVEEYCRSQGIEFEWKDNNNLRTRYIGPAVLSHPRTGEKIWFNHATFFHISTLPPSIREGMLAEFKEEDLPNNTYYGDGSVIEPEVLNELRQAYQQEMVIFPWKKGDILLLDNMLTVHARRPYVGRRKILVGMAEPIKQTHDKAKIRHVS